jgi:DNA-binding transcriptional regulator YiaG
VAKKKFSVSKVSKGRGGRKKGEWKLLTKDQLMTFRKDQRISRARLAELMGVSSTSIQNWETNTVPTMKAQQKLAQLINNPTVVSDIPRVRKPSLFDRSDDRRDAAIQATGTIVTAYLQVNRDLGQDQLVNLITRVKKELLPV